MGRRRARPRRPADVRSNVKIGIGRSVARAYSTVYMGSIHASHNSFLYLHVVVLDLG